MTQQERLVVSAYTGVLMTDFSLVHKFIEEKLGHPVWTHEFARDDTWEEIRFCLKPAFLALCGRGESETRPSRCSRGSRKLDPAALPVEAKL